MKFAMGVGALLLALNFVSPATAEAGTHRIGSTVPVVYAGVPYAAPGYAVGPYYPAYAAYPYYGYYYPGYYGIYYPYNVGYVGYYPYYYGYYPYYYPAAYYPAATATVPAAAVSRTTTVETTAVETTATAEALPSGDGVAALEARLRVVEERLEQIQDSNDASRAGLEAIVERLTRDIEAMKTAQ